MTSRRRHGEQAPRHRVGWSKKTRIVVSGICERTGKRRFPSERDAVKAAASIKMQNPRKRRKPLPIHRYRCRMCGDWHLTNMQGGDVTNRPEPTELPRQPTIGGAT